MPVQIVKKKAAVVSAEDLASIVTAEDVEVYAALKAKHVKAAAKIAPLKKELDAAEKGILTAVDEVVDEGTPVTLTGVNNELIVGAQGRRVEISDTEALFDMLGKELFLKLASISSKDLNAYLTPDQLQEVTTKRYAFKRRVKVEAI